jgi:phosphonate transport system substrate-binding protein
MYQFKTKNIFFTIVTVVLLLLMLQVKAEKKELIFGIHPYLHATTLVERFTPLTEYIGEKMGNKIHIRVATSYQDHNDAIRQGNVDFAFMGPASYVKLTETKNNYSLIGRLSFSKKSTFRGVIFSRKDTHLNSLEQLRGKKFAFGDPNSTLSTRVPQRILADAGISLSDLKNFSHLKNHHNVVLAVLLGKYDAGAVKEEIFREYESRGLKALKWTPDIPSHPFIASATMTVEQIQKLQNLMQNIHQQPNAENILHKVKKGTIAIIPAHIDEYAELRKLISYRKKSPVE